MSADLTQRYDDRGPTEGELINLLDVLLQNNLSDFHRAKLAEIQANEARREEPDYFETLDVLSKAGEPFRVLLDALEMETLKLTLRPDVIDSVAEAIALARWARPFIDSMEEASGFLRLVLMLAVIKDEGTPLRKLCAEAKSAVVEARQLQHRGIEGETFGSNPLLAAYPDLADVKIRSYQQIKNELYGRPDRKKQRVPVTVKVSYARLREIQIANVMALVDVVNDALAAKYGVNGNTGYPNVQIGRSLAVDGMVVAGPISQDWGDYVRIAKLSSDDPDERAAANREFTIDDRRLMDLMEKLKATPVPYKKGQFAVGWVATTIVLREVNLRLYIDLSPHGREDRWFPAHDDTDWDETSGFKGRVEVQAVKRATEFIFGFRPGFDWRYLSADKAQTDEKHHKEMLDEWGVIVLSDPTKAMKAAKEKGGGTFGRRMCTRCKLPKRQFRVSNFLHPLARRKHGLVPGESSDRVFKGKDKLSRPTTTCICEHCGDEETIPYISNEFEFPGLAHAARVLKTELPDKELRKLQQDWQELKQRERRGEDVKVGPRPERPLDSASAKRASHTSHGYSQRESSQNALRRKGFGIFGSSRRQWGCTYEVNELMAILCAHAANGRQLVHAGAWYHDALAELKAAAAFADGRDEAQAA